MDQHVQYATTRDGFDIAFAVRGEGPVLIYMPQPLMTAMSGRAAGPAGVFDERLAESFRVVSYDSRGCGLSTRKIARVRLDELIADVDAIIDKLKLEEFFVWAEFDSGPAAVALAARYPDRVKNWSSGAAGHARSTSSIKTPGWR